MKIHQPAVIVATGARPEECFHWRAHAGEHTFPLAVRVRAVAARELLSVYGNVAL